jgi:hypothetical protein
VQLALKEEIQLNFQRQNQTLDRRFETLLEAIKDMFEGH